MAVSGDMFLGFIGNKLHLEVKYKNRVGFMSCFVFRRITLNEPSFMIKEADIEIACERALIEPDFSEIIGKGAITLRCQLKNASFLRIKEKLLESPEISAFLEANASEVFEHIIGIDFETIDTTLRLWEENLEIGSLEANGKDARITSSGTFTESGKVKLAVKVLFSPHLIESLPEDARNMLKQESDGWYSYSLNFEADRENEAMTLDSDKISIRFEKIKLR